MKNISKLLTITALLLAFVMVFAACDGSEAVVEDNGSEDDNENVVEFEPYVPHNKVNVSEIVNKWSEYIEYDEDSKDEVGILTSEAYNTLVGVSGVNLNNYNGWLVSTSTEEILQNLDPTNPESVAELVATVVTIKLDAPASDEIEFTYKNVIPAIDDEGKCLGSYSHADYVRYTVEAIPAINNGIVVSKTVKKLITNEAGDTELDPLLDSNYETVTTYTYYDGEGSAIYANVDTKAEFRNSHNYLESKRVLMDVANETLLLDENGVVLRRFALGEEYNVPFFNKESATSSGSADDYAYFTVGELQYVIKEPAPAMKQLGELALYTVQGMSLLVMDKDYNAVVEYSTDCYHLAGYTVLSNGNVYICEYVQLPSTATEYDFAKADIKFNIKHTLIDVTEKTVKDLDLSFIASSLFNNVTKEINSFTNKVIISSMAGSCKIKDGYVLATIQKYSDKTLEADTCYAILDESLQVVAEFDSILPSQLSYPSFFSEEILIVTTRAIGEKVVNYAVDLDSGSVSLFVHDLNKVASINGGYFVNNKIYNKDWKEIYDFGKTGENTYLATINGTVYCTTSDYYANECIYAFYMSESGESYGWDFICSGDSDVKYCGDYFECVDYNGYSTYYAIDGSRLYSEEDYLSKTIYGENGTYGFYIGDENVSSIVKYDGYYLVTVKQEYTLSYGSEDFPRSMFETKYYVFK